MVNNYSPQSMENGHVHDIGYRTQIIVNFSNTVQTHLDITFGEL